MLKISSPDYSIKIPVLDWVVVPKKATMVLLQSSSIPFSTEYLGKR